MHRRNVLGALLGLMAGSVAGGSGTAVAAARPLGAASLVARRRRLLNATVVSQGGRRLRFYDDVLLGKTFLVNFMYTACTDDCPLTTATLVQVQRALGPRVGRDVVMCSITVDPVRDTPARLEQWAEPFGIGPGWLFLTGAKADVAQIRRAFGDDPRLERRTSNRLNLIRYGVEPRQLWAGCPAWSRPQAILRYLAWLEPGGADPMTTA